MNVRYHYFPVGQGLFSSGTLRVNIRKRNFKPFHWVYDCGTDTDSDEDLLTQSIQDFKSKISRGAAKPRLDLVVISHFHEDHINGMEELFKEFNAKRVMMPFMHLAHRLSHAFEQGLGADDALMPFYRNPVSYILGLNESIEEFIFIPPSGGEGSVPPGEGGEPPHDERDELDLHRVDENELM